MKSLSLAAGTVSLRWDNARVDVNHEKEYLSVDGESMRTADTPGYIFTSSVELSYSPKRLQNLMFFVGAYGERDVRGILCL